jgi:hypothetical protein
LVAPYGLFVGRRKKAKHNAFGKPEQHRFLNENQGNSFIRLLKMTGGLLFLEVCEIDDEVRSTKAH